MIFATVGTQLAFDRLINLLDQWAAKHTDQTVIAQVGPSKNNFSHLEYFQFVAPSKANQLFKDADLIVAHAGMGSVLTALKYNKPIIIFPRKASLGEHRNEHQLATAKWLESKASVFVAWDESELFTLLDRRDSLLACDDFSNFANPDLINNLKSFINQ